MESDLAQCLRAWRDRLDPGDVGPDGDRPRRAPGLRREEVAERAGISVNDLMRLEQGRASRPSPSVERIVTRFRGVPVLVLDPARTIVAANPLALAVLADDIVGENAARTQVVGPPWVERGAEATTRTSARLSATCA